MEKRGRRSELGKYTLIVLTLPSFCYEHNIIVDLVMLKISCTYELPGNENFIMNKYFLEVICAPNNMQYYFMTLEDFFYIFVFIKFVGKFGFISWISR